MRNAREFPIVMGYFLTGFFIGVRNYELSRTSIGHLPGCLPACLHRCIGMVMLDSWLSSLPDLHHNLSFAAIIQIETAMPTVACSNILLSPSLATKRQRLATKRRHGVPRPLDIDTDLAAFQSCPAAKRLSRAIPFDAGSEGARFDRIWRWEI